MDAEYVQLADLPHDTFWRRLAEFGASDITALMDSESASRSCRIDAAFRKGAAVNDERPALQDQALFDRLWLGKDIDQVNADLHADFMRDLESIKAAKADPTVRPIHGLYSLTRNSRLISFYHCFGAKSTRFPDRLNPETEALLLELMWWRTKVKNDIAITRRSTWWMAGSENHDLNSKTTSLLTSAIFADEPQYATRAYPNKGHGCAPGYMTAGYNTASIADASRRGTGRANWSDGEDHFPAEHRDAWTAYMMEYLAERAKKGFFLENGAPGYMRYTLGYLMLMYNFCPDDALKQQTRRFLDLFWTDWAIQSLGGLRGGPKTRHHKSAGGYDAMSDFARFFLGGEGMTGANYAQQVISDYELSPMIWAIVLDREGLGSFAYVSRGIGEEETTCPRPPGVERTMMGNCESRFVKYSWVTPDYVLGTQMDHPLAVHNHLSTAGRWQGLITADPDASIATVSMTEAPRMNEKGGYCTELMYHSAQHQQVLITQQRRRWTQINPDWFPAYEGTTDIDFGIYVGKSWARTEKDGWLFLEHGNTYAAIRIIRLKCDPDPMAFAKGTDRYAHDMQLEDDTHSWKSDGTIMLLTNKYSPIIIEAGRRAAYPTLAEFQNQILSNTLEVHRTVNTQETRIIVVYKGANGEEIVFNAANAVDVPTIGGTPINFSHPKTFDAPYLQSDYDSGAVTISTGNRKKVLDFNQIAARK